MMNVLLQPTEQTRSRRKAEVVNELLWVAGPKERSPALAPGPLFVSCEFLVRPVGGPPTTSTYTTTHTQVHSHTHQNKHNTHKSTSATPPYGAQLEHRSRPFGQRECESSTESKTKPQWQLAAQQEPQMGPGQARQACR